MRATFPVIIASALLSSTTLPSYAWTADETMALTKMQEATDAVVTVCHNSQTNDVFFFSSAIVSQRPSNPFTPILTPPGLPEPGSVFAYYQLAFYRRPDGRQLPRLLLNTLQVSDADMRNGISARFSGDMYVPSYRIYDVRTRTWSPWTDAGTDSTGVKIASFVVEHDTALSQWRTIGGFLFNVEGGTMKAPSCGDVPPG